MATLEQLESEPYWGREVVTSELSWLGDELCRRTGQPASAAGDKGNTSHLRGAHRSQEWLLRSAYATSRSYTVQSGLTGEQLLVVAGFDFVPGEWGTAENRRRMVAQTGRLFAALEAGLLAGVREVIGTLDGRTVTGRTSAGAVISSDSSHLDHWHLTLDRRQMRNGALMARIVTIALGDDDMIYLAKDSTGQVWACDGITRRRVPADGLDGFRNRFKSQLYSTTPEMVGLLDAFGQELTAGGLSVEAVRAIVREELASVPKTTADLVHEDLAD